MKNKNIERIIYGLIFLGLAALTTVAINRNFFELQSLNPVFHQAIFKESPNVRLFYIVGIVFILFRRLLIYFFPKSNVSVKQFFIAFAPISLFALYLVGIPHGFWEPILFVIVCSWVLYRLCIQVKLPAKIPIKKCSARTSILIIAGLFIVLTAYGFSMQRKALDVMYMTFYDWGEFLAIADNSLKGKWFITNVTVPGRNFLSVHFAPGSLLLLIAYVKCFPGVNALFILNSALLFTMPILVYVLGRKLKLSRNSALILSLAAFLSPSLANLNLTSFHGFHLISFMIPALLLFFIFLETKRFAAAFAIFLFSLTFKETVGAFWVGMGVVLFFLKYRKTGLAISVIGGAYMILAMKVFMPPVPGVKDYMFLDRYGHLGGSISEVALSPLLRPEAFFGSLFRLDCVYFVVLLLLPVFPLVMRRPMLLLGASVTLLFVCVQQSTRFQNISAQYQTEAMVLVYICAVLAAADVMKNRTCKWYDWVMTLGMHCYATRRRRLFAALSATLCSAVMASFFFAESDWGKNSFSLQRNKKDWTKEIAEMRALIPKEASMNATYHLAPHFIMRNDVYASLDGPLDYVLLDLDDPYNFPHKLMGLRKKLLESDKYSVAYNRAFSNNHFMLFVPSQGKPVNKKTPRMLRLTDQQWPFIGKEIKVPNMPDFSVRAALRKVQGRRFIMLYTRLKRQVKYDIKITAVISDGKKQLIFANYFGDGLQPAYMQQKGDVYLMLLPIPDNWQKVKSCRVKIIRKKL